MNSHIVSQLNKLGNHHKTNGELFRAMAYIKAANAISELGFVIEDVEQIKDIKGIGPSIMSRITEIIVSGGLAEMEDISKEHKKRIGALEQFQKIYGIGPVAAAKLYDTHNISTLQQLKKASRDNPDLLTNAQKIGLKYYKDIEKRIPSKFISSYENMLNEILSNAFGDTFRIVIAGSYRRGKPTSGDIDIMLLTNSFTLSEAVEVMIQYNLIVEILALDVKKFMGIGSHKNKLHPYNFRVDIFMIREVNWWVALVTHTGPKELNTHMRRVAAENNMRLSDQGLITNGKKVKVNSEQHLFKILKMDYIEPTSR